MIPDKSGFQILQELKQDAGMDKIPVIVITAKDLTEEERQLLVQNDVNSTWKKGQIDREKLIAQVKAQLE